MFQDVLPEMAYHSRVYEDKPLMIFQSREALKPTDENKVLFSDHIMYLILRYTQHIGYRILKRRQIAHNLKAPKYPPSFVKSFVFSIVNLYILISGKEWLNICNDLEKKQLVDLV